VPREAFVPRARRRRAYDDAPLPIGSGQTISQPYIVALMLEALELGTAPADPDVRALDVGTGSGYAAAVMSRIVAHVYTVERHERLAREAGRRFERLGYDNVSVRHGDGTRGWPEHAPYRGIAVAAAADAVPPALRDQLAVGGCLVVPVSASFFGQRLLRIRRLGVDRFAQDTLASVRFVPLVAGEPE